LDNARVGKTENLRWGTKQYCVVECVTISSWIKRHWQSEWV
jgi:hypothetical protein